VFLDAWAHISSTTCTGWSGDGTTHGRILRISDLPIYSMRPNVRTIGDGLCPLPPVKPQSRHVQRFVHEVLAVKPIHVLLPCAKQS